MSIELHVLALTTLLWAALLAVAAIGAGRQVGVDYLLSPRDEARPLDGAIARLERALKNQTDALVLFTATVVVVELGERQSGFTAGCALVFLAARVLYIPAYAFGWNPWRSVIWDLGFMATLAMLIAALLG